MYLCVSYSALCILSLFSVKTAHSAWINIYCLMAHLIRTLNYLTLLLNAPGYNPSQHASNFYPLKRQRIPQIKLCVLTFQKINGK